MLETFGKAGKPPLTITVGAVLNLEEPELTVIDPIVVPDKLAEAEVSRIKGNPSICTVGDEEYPPPAFVTPIDERLATIEEEITAPLPTPVKVIIGAEV